jgi:hypothetical protein
MDVDLNPWLDKGQDGMAEQLWRVQTFVRRKGGWENSKEVHAPPD